MSALKVCVYAICKDEVRFVDQWMDSMSEADMVVVTDTGSTDGTVEALRQRGAVVHTAEVKPWRFDAARNISLNNVPDDVDICVCTDLDELFTPGWRRCLETAWRNHKPLNAGPVARSGRYLYNWSLKPDGSPDIQFNYFKVHDRHGFHWKCPVHEFVHYEGPLPLEIVYIEGMVLNHHPDPAKSRGSYLPLLEMAVLEDPSDERMRYYLGREYLYRGEWQGCISTLIAYLGMKNATWNDERSAAMRWIAQSFQRMGADTEAYRWYYRAIAESPKMRDAYVEFSKMCLEGKDWRMAYFLAKEALRIKEKSRTFVNMGYAWDHTPDDLCAVAAYQLNLFEDAREHAERALAHTPTDARLLENLRLIAERI